MVKREEANPGEIPTESDSEASERLRHIAIDVEVFEVATGTLEISGAKQRRASFRAEGSLVQLEAFLKGETPGRTTLFMRFRRRARVTGALDSGAGRVVRVGSPREQEWLTLADLPNYLSGKALRHPRDTFLRYAAAHGMDREAERIAEDLPEKLARPSSDLDVLRNGILEAAALTLPSRDDRFSFSGVAGAREENMVQASGGDSDLANIALAISRAFDWLRIAADQPLQQFMEAACLRFYEGSGIFGTGPAAGEPASPAETADRAAWAARVVSRLAIRKLAAFAVLGDERVLRELAQGGPSVWGWPWVVKSLEALRRAATDPQTDTTSQRAARSLLDAASTLPPLPRGRPRSSAHQLATEVLPLVKASMRQTKSTGQIDVKPDARLALLGITPTMMHSALRDHAQGRGYVSAAEELVRLHFGFRSISSLKRAVERTRKAERERDARPS